MNRKCLSSFVLLSSLSAFLCGVWGTEVRADVRDQSLIVEPRILNTDGVIEFSFNDPQYIQKIELTALGIARDAMFEVMVNGDIKGSIYVPGQDPHYWVTVADTTNRIVLRHLRGGSVRILSMHAYIVMPDESPTPQVSEDSVSAAELISLRTIKQMSALQARVSTTNFKNYVLPIKISAGHAYGIARASGDLSLRLRRELEGLLYHFRRGHLFFESLMAQSELFDDATAALEIEYQLQDFLD